MIVKKIGKTVYGAQFSSAEQKALDIEIKKQTAEIVRKNANEIDAMFLWYLHEKYGFGYDRLKQAHNYFKPTLESMCERYDMNTDEDKMWLCTKKLLDYGIDIEAWNAEVV